MYISPLMMTMMILFSVFALFAQSVFAFYARCLFVWSYTIQYLFIFIYLFLFNPGNKVHIKKLHGIKSQKSKKCLKTTYPKILNTIYQFLPKILKTTERWKLETERTRSSEMSNSIINRCQPPLVKLCTQSLNKLGGPSSLSMSVTLSSLNNLKYTCYNKPPYV